MMTMGVNEANAATCRWLAAGKNRRVKGGVVKAGRLIFMQEQLKRGFHSLLPFAASGITQSRFDDASILFES